MLQESCDAQLQVSFTHAAALIYPGLFLTLVGLVWRRTVVQCVIFIDSLLVFIDNMWTVNLLIQWALRSLNIPRQGDLGSIEHNAIGKGLHICKKKKGNILCIVQPTFSFNAWCTECLPPLARYVWSVAWYFCLLWCSESLCFLPSFYLRCWSHEEKCYVLPAFTIAMFVFQTTIGINSVDLVYSLISVHN